MSEEDAQKLKATIIREAKLYILAKLEDCLRSLRQETHKEWHDKM